MSSSNCCLLTCIEISQEAGKVTWYSHLFKNFPQFVVIQIRAFKNRSRSWQSRYLNDFPWSLSSYLEAHTILHIHFLPPPPNLNTLPLTFLVLWPSCNSTVVLTYSGSLVTLDTILLYRLELNWFLMTQYCTFGWVYCQLKLQRLLLSVPINIYILNWIFKQ